MKRRITRERAFRLMWIVLILSVLFVLSAFYTQSTYLVVIIESYVLLFIILVSLMLEKDDYLLNPFTIFSIMYATTPITVFYLVSSNFEKNVYVTYNINDERFISLLEISLLYFIIGYIMFTMGYSIKKKKTKWASISDSENKDIENSKSINKVELVIIFLFFSIAVINFIYVVYKTNGGNIIQYISYFSARKYVYNITVSTTGYNFGYISTYMYAIYLQEKGKKYSVLFWLMFLTMVIIRVSTGRIFNTVTYIAIVFSIIYHKEVTRLSVRKKRTQKTNKKYIRYAVVLFVGAVFFYFYRVIAMQRYQGVTGTTNELMQSMINNISYYIFDKGNSVNIALVPRIIDSWGTDIGFLFGRSLLSSLDSFVPYASQLFPMTSVLVKTTWYGNIIGGALPPTCIGEFYANFGIFGITLGMFLFGFFCSKFYNWFKRNDCDNSFRIIYYQVLIGFIFIFPKNDFTNFPAFGVLLTLFSYYLVKLFDKGKRKR